MNSKRVASAVLFTLVSGARAAPRERVLPVIEIHASAMFHVSALFTGKQPMSTGTNAIADSVLTTVMARWDETLLRKSRAARAQGVRPSQGAFAVDLHSEGAVKR